MELFIFAVVAAVYLIPLIIAYKRDHEYVALIALINIFFGWTAIGWVGTLIWAIVGTTKGDIKESSAPRMDVADEIKKLNDLKNDGALTSEEFDMKKQQLLNI